jgi:hypothetical protein
MNQAGLRGGWRWSALLAAVLLAGAAAWWLGHGGRWRAVPTVVVRGGDGGGLPRATPAEEGFDAAALDAALALAREQGMHAFIVSRHGHVVLAEYAHGLDAQSTADAGGFAAALVALAAGAARSEGLVDDAAIADFDPPRLAAAIAAGARMSYPEFLARDVWQPLNAAAAAIELPAAGAVAPADCCIIARISDWMRVAELLLNAGRFEGTQVAPPEWVRRMPEARDAARERGWGVWLAIGAHGAEPFAADGVFYLKGPARWRLWMAPTLGIAVLFAADGADDARWDETRLPNRVFRALVVRPSIPGHPSLSDIVPGH